MKWGYLLLFFGFVLLGGAIFWGEKLISALPQKTSLSALEVEAIPESRVFLDGKELGKTPLENEKLVPGEYTLGLMSGTNASFSSWERKIKLNPRLLTYVNYLFGPTEKESAGEILSLEKIGTEKGEVVVLSDPDGAEVSLDGSERGVTPQALSGFETGEHKLTLSLPGYLSRSLKIKTWAGHKLLVNVKLAGIVESASPAASPSTALRVKILDTPTGFLRVRAESSLSATETAQVKPGEEYPLLEEEEDWFKIRYDEGREGWIASSYAQKID